MNLKKWWSFLLALTFSVLLLAACNGGDDETGTDPEEPADDNGEEPADDENGDDDGDDDTAGEASEGGNVNIAFFSPPEHQFNPIYYTSTYDANVMDFIFEALFRTDDELLLQPHLAESYELNDDQTEMTVTLNEGITWHDGEAFTADDVVFTYEMISHPEYTGVRGTYADKLVGYEDFRAGESDEFEGVTAEDDQTVIFRWEESSVTPEFNASFPIIPEHIFGAVEPGEIESHESSIATGEVVGTGPFMLGDFVEGDQYVLNANEDYWNGAPNLDTVTLQVRDQAVITGLLESGDVDMVIQPDGIVPSDVASVEQMDNVTLYQPQDLGYQYMGFKIGYRPSEDVEAGVIDTDNFIENEKLSDVRVRQAIVHALDREAMVGGEDGEGGLLQGSGQVLHAPFPEASWAFDENADIGLEYDTDRAMELLAEAGYEDTNGDGFVEDPNGEEYVLTLAYPTGNEPRENAAIVIEQQLAEVGINVNVDTPREFPAHSEIVENDDQSIDMYLMGWGLASGDPDPGGIFTSHVPYNYTRWVDETSDEMIQRGLSAPDAFEQEYREEVYSEWAEYVSEQVPYAFLWSMINNWAATDRVGGITEDPVTMLKDPHLWYVQE
ncbi:oligopeptide ABC transporter, periplasmic oligopeptide-binding protein OppA [Geomicrobium sp. JCM 19037]|uniref:ABC transporter substrate-binding protein n=1 Tax=unclassified Geomicrobium TaxID=2628951 RepID=UPI00045F1C51|nr:ABC transporter substrate-binding protein [Geomicrobium sp. JCM 19037]GAK04803.1 oligopeptide ABC transporter, periplasmic oligopeptide-binding protein OppA [Geomicrobium sp. JCM 19037]